MAAEPQIKALRRSERDVWCYLAGRADEDGVVRSYISTNHLAGKTGYSCETVRKAVHRLERLQLLRCIPGIGRTCSLYAVPRALSSTIMIMEPEAPTPEPIPQVLDESPDSSDLAQPMILRAADGPDRVAVKRLSGSLQQP